MQRTHTQFDSPVGLLTLVAAGSDVPALIGLYMDRQRHRPLDDTFGVPDTRPFVAVQRQLREYFAGERAEFDVPLAPVGTAFQRRVWSALCDIPYGETVTYGELAQEIGRPTAARAVGLANGRNPIGIIVPCHRVVSSTGKLIGYGGGLERKRFLLDFERRITGAEPS